MENHGKMRERWERKWQEDCEKYGKIMKGEIAWIQLVPKVSSIPPRSQHENRLWFFPMFRGADLSKLKIKWIQMVWSGWSSWIQWFENPAGSSLKNLHISPHISTAAGPPAKVYSPLMSARRLIKVTSGASKASWGEISHQRSHCQPWPYLAMVEICWNHLLYWDFLIKNSHCLLKHSTDLWRSIHNGSSSSHPVASQ